MNSLTCPLEHRSGQSLALASPDLTLILKFCTTTYRPLFSSRRGLTFLPQGLCMHYFLCLEYSVSSNHPSSSFRSGFTCHFPKKPSLSPPCRLDLSSSP